MTIWSSRLPSSNLSDRQQLSLLTCLSFSTITMQHQLTLNATRSVNQTQSLAAVQTLLRAGLGTITYLRNLLPEDNFTRSHFTSVDDSGTSYDSSQESSGSRTSVSGFRITTITRGYTDEADRLLNYMEYGIFDALEKQYLRSFIFGIYLDTKDPTNIIEAYTFNFKYHMIPGSDVFIPVMSLADKQKQHGAGDDPIAKALMQGRPPTLKDVKMSVKALLKTLIQAISNMDVLPRRRYATFKVFYTEETPPDYEPPHFEPGDAEKDKWYFMTHDLDEVPERTSIGKIHTGYHSVNLNVTSIASFLPSSEQADNGTFCGLTTHPGNSNLTPLQEAALHRTQAEKQLDDAKNRNLVWPVEDTVNLSDLDAEGEDDPDYIQLQGGHFETVGEIAPVGVRDESGTVVPHPIQQETGEAYYGGISDKASRHLHEIMAAEHGVVNVDLEETQTLGLTQKDPSHVATSVEAFDPEMLKDMHIDTLRQLDVEMLDLETQIPISESIDCTPNMPKQLNIRQLSDGRSYSEQNDNELQCECAITLGGDVCYCEGGCHKWFHLWCMGYHSVTDPRLPLKFICFECRLRKDVNWELIRVELYPRMMSKFRDIALFRRAIKVAQALKSFSSAEFSKKLGGNAVSAAHMLKILEDEDYVLQESVMLDNMGLSIATRYKKGRGTKPTTAKPKPRKNVQKRKYVFNPSIETRSCYVDYFSPEDGDAEARLLGLNEMVKAGKLKTQAVTENVLGDMNTQTQKETQNASIRTFDTEDQNIIKRSSDFHLKDVRPAKKLKMSVALGVDLAE